MKKIIINFNKEQREYDIFIGTGLVEKITKICDLSGYSRIFVITDEIIKPLFLETLLRGLSIPASSIILTIGEKEKHIGNVKKIWKAMLDFGCDRKSLVINLGGGVICDMGGFAASTYMRGVDFINIPTTLLSQVDASVGGKTGIDFAGIKNLIGTFNQPKAVIIDVDTLKTLPEREFLSGFGEIIKHGLISDKEYFEKIIRKNPTEFTENELVEIITASCQKKADIVKSDEKESNTRKILNFGHTIGHAIEALSLATDDPLLHGEAVSIGMVAEAKISQKIGFISEEDVRIIEKSLENAGLPISVSNINIEEIKKKMLSDKKNNKGRINFVLLKKIGEAIIDQKISNEIITEALRHFVR